MDTRTGRGRFYGITPAEGFTDRSFAMLSSWMDELRERVYDQVVDLPEDALNHKAANTNLTIGKLMLHLAWAEAIMVSKITKREIPGNIRSAIEPGAKTIINNEPLPSPPAADLIDLCRRVRDEVTVPGLHGLENVDKPCLDDGSTPRGILDQLLWHWTYHSGQIGLIRFEWGSDYDWSFDGPMAPEPT